MIKSNKIETFQAPQKRGNVQSEVVSSPSKGGRLQGGERSEGCLEDLCFVWKTASPDRYGILKKFAQENRNNMTEKGKKSYKIYNNTNYNNTKLKKKNNLTMSDFRKK